MPRRNSDHPDYGADVVPLFEAACRLGMHPKTYVKGIDLGQLPGTVTLPTPVWETVEAEATGVVDVVELPSTGIGSAA